MITERTRNTGDRNVRWNLVLLGAIGLACGVRAAAPPVTTAAAVEAGFSRIPPPTEVVAIAFPPHEARFVRLIIHRTNGGAPGLDELEVYGPGAEANLARADRGAVASASSVIAGYRIHAVAHLNDGRTGNDYSWIAASEGPEWAQIELPANAPVARVAFSRDRTGGFSDRQPVDAEVWLSLDGRGWQSVARLARQAPELHSARLTFPVARVPAKTWEGVLHYAFLCERDTWRRLPADDFLSPLANDRPAFPGGAPYWGRIAQLGSLERVLVLFEEMIERLAEQGVDTVAERREWEQLRQQVAADPGAAASDALYLAARQAKRRLFWRDPGLAPLDRVLFAKQHPLKPSHNYSEHFDSLFAPGGGVYVLRVPRDGAGRLAPAQGEVECLFDAEAGIARHPVADFEAETVYFAYRPDRPEVEGWERYWHLMAVRTDGRGLRKLTAGPYHDFDPVPLPDGGLAFMSTRCQVRFLCWRPQAYVLHRMETDGRDLRRLSFANLSEWSPSILRDGRLLWTRSEYQDKGADFGHTLWAIRPDGTFPELVFGNNTPYCYDHGHEVPGTRELVTTLFSHGDHQGPIALIDLSRGPYDTRAITSITPDTRPQYQMDRSGSETFRDPVPVSRDHFLVSHNPGAGDHWGLYVIDRYGNRELLYLDLEISSKRPSLLRPRVRPPTLPSLLDPDLANEGLGQFTVQDVYAGLEPTVARGRVKSLRVIQEVPSPLAQLPSGQYRNDFPRFQDHYASPIQVVHGPPSSYRTRTANALELHAFRTGQAAAAGDGLLTITERQGWPSYVAKAALGTVPVAADGSANFLAPAGKVLYFQLLDEDGNELQRMRSVVQLQPGERRGCVGCHEARQAAPRPEVRPAVAPPVQRLEPPPWGAVPFDYERVVQPVLDAHCVRCHDGRAVATTDLRGVRDAERVPASYRSLVAGGWVHFFDWAYGGRHFKAEPLSFGTLQSRLWTVLADADHDTVVLEADDRLAVKTWIDLNCPLWPDYQDRMDRPE